MTNRLVQFLMLMCSLWAVGGSASACSCIGPQPVCSVYFGTPSIFRGTVVEKTLDRPALQPVRNLDGSSTPLIGPGLFKVRFRVDENFRGGDTGPERTIYTNDQGSACGFSFQVGVEYVVFGFANKAGTSSGRRAARSPMR